MYKPLTIILEESVEAVQRRKSQISMILSQIARQQWYTVRLILVSREPVKLLQAT